MNKYDNNLQSGKIIRLRCIFVHQEPVLELMLNAGEQWRRKPMLRGDYTHVGGLLYGI